MEITLQISEGEALRKTSALEAGQLRSPGGPAGCTCCGHAVLWPRRLGAGAFARVMHSRHAIPLLFNMGALSVTLWAPKSPQVSHNLILQTFA